MYIGTAEQGELQESKRPPGSSGASVRSGVVLVRCCCMRACGVYIVARMANAGNPSNGHQSSSGDRWVTRGLGEQMNGSWIQVGTWKFGKSREKWWNTEIWKILNNRKTDEKRIKFNLDKNLKKVWRTHRTTFPCDSYAIPWNQYTRLYICNMCMHHAS